MGHRGDGRGVMCGKEVEEDDLDKEIYHSHLCFVVNYTIGPCGFLKKHNSNMK